MKSHLKQTFKSIRSTHTKSANIKSEHMPQEYDVIEFIKQDKETRTHDVFRVTDMDGKYTPTKLEDS